ncbi:MAG: Hpt domain-containing protein, partial [Myxococcota bacterium]
MARWVDRILGPRLRHATADDRRRAGLMVLGAGLVLMLGAAGVALPYIAEGHTLFGVWMLSTMLVSSMAVLTLRWTGNVNLAAHHLIGSLMLTLIGGWVLGGGVHSPLFVTLPAAIVVAFMLGGARIGAIWSGVGLIVMLGCAGYLSAVGPYTWALPEAVAVEKRLFEPIPISIGIFFLVLAFESSRARAFASAEEEKDNAQRAHQSVQLILDNAGQGFLSLDAQGRLQGAGSRIVQEWIGLPEAGGSFAAYVGQVAPATQEAFEMAWEQIEDGFLPLELVVDQLPKHMLARGRHLRLSYRPIVDGEALDRMIVIITDISDQIAREAAETRQKDLMAAFQKAIENRQIFTEFMDESGRMVTDLRQGALHEEIERRRLHTLKGNCSIYGIHGFAALCHDIEERLLERGGMMLSPERAELTDAWQGLDTEIRTFLGEGRTGRIELDAQVYHRHLSRILSGVPHQSLAREARLWSYEAVSDRLAVLAESGQALAQRLGKGDIHIHIDGHGLR